MSDTDALSTGFRSSAGPPASTPVLCPMHALTAYDRISYGYLEVVATVQGISKHLRDSVIMLHDDDLYRAGRLKISQEIPGAY